LHRTRGRPRCQRACTEHPINTAKKGPSVLFWGANRDPVGTALFPSPADSSMCWGDCVRLLMQLRQAVSGGSLRTDFRVAFAGFLMLTVADYFLL
jgi:hypothetical protein